MKDQQSEVQPKLAALQLPCNEMVPNLAALSAVQGPVSALPVLCMPLPARCGLSSSTSSALMRKLFSVVPWRCQRHRVGLDRITSRC